MRILIVGGSGTVGKAAAAELGRRHDIIRAGRSSGDLTVDVMSEASVKAMYAKLGKVDAVVTTVGHVHFGPVATMTPEQFRKGLDDKLMGQVNIVLLGMDHVNDNGSFTLTSGILDRDPVRQGANAAAVNGAIGAFVRGAAIEMPRGIRINAVSPGLLEDSAAKYDGFFPGHEPVSNARVGLAYAKSVDGALTGQVICVG
ncbi:short chain dehydrogenase [Aestuariivirga litoralis]|uniref:Short chain dehydrogenase n=1 Tax=Aestuariivirga litoralis TaxID=2650924 RepID=A0A2W2BEG8_9HYPH|nr:short chain dehydrogenase [Aestuariivirga litoralis]PZF78578.1 short chain dehydrogenase [Aestuariivirga litoralis]